MPKSGQGEALTEKMCPATSDCKCTSSSAQFLSLTCARPVLETMLLEHGHLVNLLEPDLKVKLNEPSESKSVKAQDWWDDNFPCSGNWGLTKIGVPEATHRGDGVKIFVLDTGVRANHPDFGNPSRAIPTKDFSNSKGNCPGANCCADGHGHGTHTAGTAIGNTYGVAKGATAHAIKVLNDDGSGALSWTLKGLDYVTYHSGVVLSRVASMSIDLPERSQSLDTMVGMATDNGVIVVVAAGNEHQLASSISPAGSANAITVGATTNKDEEASYSNYGPAVNIFAPGSFIRSASNTDEAACMSGTSMACPHVSGAAALILQANPTANWHQVLDQLQASSTKNSIKKTHQDDPVFMLNVRGARSYSETQKAEQRFRMLSPQVLVSAATLFGCFLVGFSMKARKFCRSRASARNQLELTTPTERPSDADLAA